ncbi:hypothetical protein FB45DRAFT_1053342 [Roridomyces roridus]|uniref:F-box domain-containing protein n=1 Tax=Roridomyces roridus TaxID=1738132 RepID=A0AAD7CCC4_9AGAR|nr:hypothetical protein FB45DRAFT_1053342 [Roridomyces roridus]
MNSIIPAFMLDNPSTANFTRQVKGYIRVSEANIARIEAQIQDLTRLRDQERELISALKPLIAPIRKLPVELLTEIFLLAVGSKKEWLIHALVVSQVCAHWRRVACATPQLWNGEIALNLTKPRSDVYLATTKTFFERSTPLSIPVLLENEPVEASPLAEYIYSLAPRWKASTWTQSTSSRLSALPWGVLNSLEIVHLTRCTDVPSSSPIDVFLSAQRLRDAALDLRSMGYFRMPWSQLTSLKIFEAGGEPKPAQLFLDMLSQCTNIVDVHFSKMVPYAEDAASSAPIIHLPRLQKLALIFTSGDVTPFFSRLALPGLKALQLYGSFAQWSSEVFAQFQRRSPNVNKLSLVGVRLTSDRTVSLLKECTHLVDIDLAHSFHDAASISFAVDFLRYDNTAAPSAPQLRRFSIHDGWVTSVDEAVWKKMILSRWWTDQQLEDHSGVRLESLSISSSGTDEFSAPFLAKMEQLRTEGLQVTIT